MAAPRKAPGEKRDSRLNARYTSAELVEIERAADALGITAAEFSRRRTLGFRLPSLRADQRAQAHLATALIRIGNNLNQLTKHANAGRIQPASITDTLDRINAYLDGLYDAGSDETRPEL